MKLTIKEMTIISLLTALTYVFTAFVNIRLPIAANGGLIHLGNLPLFIGAVIFGKKAGAISGAFGMALFDLLSGWTLWAPFTFLVVGCMGYVVGLITEKKKGYVTYVASFVLALLIKVVGYYVAEWVIYGNPFAPMASIPGNVIQICVAAVIALMVIEPVRHGANAILASA